MAGLPAGFWEAVRLAADLAAVGAGRGESPPGVASELSSRPHAYDRQNLVQAIDQKVCIVTR
jgi:hypothetical protein